MFRSSRDFSRATMCRSSMTITTDVDLWGKDFYAHFIKIYSKEERYVVMVISRHYAEKV